MKKKEITKLTATEVLIIKFGGEVVTMLDAIYVTVLVGTASVDEFLVWKKPINNKYTKLVTRKTQSYQIHTTKETFWKFQSSNLSW